jgi:hypothetical protein
VKTPPVTRKVIGFDSWTVGAQNFARIARAFAESGCDFRVVHIGSWGGDLGRPAAEQVQGVEYRDILAYGSNRLEVVLDVERPCAVVFLSVDTFAHRAFNRLCMKRRIPTLHLYHGLVSVQDVQQVRGYRVNLRAQARFILERIPKALCRIWPAYAASMLATGATLSDWARFVGDILVMASGRRPRKAAPDARTDKCCVYVEADIDHAVRRYGFSADQVLPVGNPDLYQFGLEPHDAGSHLRADDRRVEVMYIDTGLVYTGLVFSSRAHFVQHLVRTRDALAAQQGLRLVFKPHPDHQRSGMLDELAAAGIAMCSRDDFMPRLRQCRAAIVEPSSLSILPALLGMPLLLAQYGPLTGQPYGSVLTGYPRHRMLTDLDRAGTLLKEEAARVEVPHVQAWIARNAGPLPAEAMPGRVVQIVLAMAEDQATAATPAPLCRSAMDSMESV